MDFLDPKKMRHQNILLYVGYVLIGIAILTTALILLYQSNGFGINKEGEVIQNGLVFTGSTPDGAQIYLKGENTGDVTNKRLVLAAGKYVLQFKKAGYNPWSRSISVDGGSVNRFDYAFLFPTKPETTVVSKFTQQIPLATQSPDRRWILVQNTTDNRDYQVFDLKNPTKAPVSLTVPATVFTAGEGSSLKLVEWSNDNSHVLLQHTFSGKTEFVMIDRESPDKSINLNTTLGVAPTELRLIDKKYDKYYVYTANDKLLQTATLGEPTPLNYLKNVLAFKSYSDNMMLYVTDDTKVDSPTQTGLAVKLAVGEQNYTIRKISAGTKYVLDIAKYSGDLYLIAGVNTENKTVVYKNPIDQINDKNIGVAVQTATLKVPNPNYVSFSANTRFIMTENGTNFGVYDAETDKSYTYDIANKPLDAPQEHVAWMDGHRMMYVSGGKTFVFEYDLANRQTLGAADPNFIPALTPDYRRMFVVAPQGSAAPADPAAASSVLTSTWLRIQSDR
jgi:hypothetical protein